MLPVMRIFQLLVTRPMHRRGCRVSDPCLVTPEIEQLQKAGNSERIVPALLYSDML